MRGFHRFLILVFVMVFLLSGLAVAGIASAPGGKIELGFADSGAIRYPWLPDDFPMSRLAPFRATEKFTYIVVGSAPALAVYEGGLPGLAPTDPTTIGAKRGDAGTIASHSYLAFLSQQQTHLISGIESTLGRSVDVRFRYQAVLNGFALQLTPDEADRIASLPGVQRVVRDFARHILTDNGPTWIGAPAIWDDGAAGTKGEGIVVGIIDTGINADHPSFADVGPVDGYDHANPRGRFFGNCDPITGAPLCNDKLIGVYDFTPAGTGADEVGHGSHTASTVAGNVLDAELVAPTMTLTRRISGVAPHANIIAYKACVGLTAPAGECLLSALLAAINQATLDEVDVINFSIGGGPSDPWTDADSLAFLNARRAGVFVAASAGNAGPGPGTVGSPANAPWLLTVGASTHDRRLLNGVINMAGGSSPPPADLSGKSLTSGYGPAPIVYAGAPPYNAPLCGEGLANPTTGEAEINPFPPGTFHGEIVVCDRGTYGRVEKGQNVKEGGAGGMVLANDAANGDSLVGDPHALPAVHISFSDGQILKAWLASGTGQTATIRGTTLDIRPENGDVMASFSSRGPNAASGIIKPDVTTPGVDILAAFHDGAGPAPQYGVISGTSMSSPHAAGAAALIRALHPTWTPDEVRSALMTTAFTAFPGTGPETHGVLKEDSATPADPFDMGAGRIDLRVAGLAGLVLDVAADDYDAANPSTGGDPRTLNLPSMADGACDGTCFWTRQVTSTSSVPVTWTLSTSAAPGVSLIAAPGSITVLPGATRTIVVTAGVDAATPGRWHFGQVTLTPDVAGIPKTHLPVAIFVKGTVLEERKTLHFHGNAGPLGEDHDSGHPEEGFCTGDGKTDLIACNGPFLLSSSNLSPSVAASWKGGPPEWTLDGGNDRTIHDPNWVWCLAVADRCTATETPVPGDVTLEGPMTVEWWATCLALCPLGPSDWFVRLFADGATVVAQQVGPTIIVDGVVQRLQVTVDLPRVTARQRITLQLEPVFLVDSSILFAIYYDSTEACPTADAGPCDSVVHLPVVPPTPPNQQPDAIDDSATTPRDTPVSVNVLANDVDPDGDALTVLSTTQGQMGSVANNGDGTVTYAPDPGVTGEDSFTYTISDGRGGSDTAVVRITVPNEPPIALNDAATTRPNTPVTVVVLWNDEDPDDDPLDVTDVTDPPKGTATLNADNSVTYTPDSSFTGGTDSFSYTVVDDHGGSASATVTITVSTQKLPDLQVTELQAANNRKGDRVTITATIRNPGTAKAAASQTEFLVDGQSIGLVDTASIAAGGQRRVSIVWNPGPESGPHLITAKADRNGQVAEANETNNERSITFPTPADWA